MVSHHYPRNPDTLNAMKTVLTLTAVLIGTTSLGFAVATPLFSDDFEPTTDTFEFPDSSEQILPKNIAGEPLQNTNDGTRWRQADGDEFDIPDTVILSDSADLFGKGTDNQYLQMGLADSDDWEVRNRDFDGSGDDGRLPVMTIFFEFIEPSGFDGFLNIRLRNGARRAQFGIDNGFIGATSDFDPPTISSPVFFGEDTLQWVNFIANESDETVFYDFLGITYSIAPDTADLWLSGVLVQDDVVSGTSQGNMDQIRFEGDGDQRLLIDNYKVFEGAVVAIPEPSSIGLLAMGSALVLLFLRKRS